MHFWLIGAKAERLHEEKGLLPAAPGSEGHRPPPAVDTMRCKYGLTKLEAWNGGDCEACVRHEQALRLTFTKYVRAKTAAEMSPNELFFELYRRKALAAARRSLAIVSALVG